MTQDNIFPRPIPITPIPLPDPIELEEIADEVDEQERPDRDGRVSWVGSDAAPQKADDGISDLFEFDVEAEMEDVDDLVDVDFEKDILDADENGGLEDLVNVSQEDIVGRVPPKRRRVARRPVRNRRQLPPTMGGLNV